MQTTTKEPALITGCRSCGSGVHLADSTLPGPGFEGCAVTFYIGGSSVLQHGFARENRKAAYGGLIVSGGLLKGAAKFDCNYERKTAVTRPEHDHSAAGALIQA
eukprot:937169-Pelagomonas_calceolata.AAC.1